LDTQVLGISIDHEPCLVAWAESFGGINYPLLSDFWPHGAVAQRFGVLKDEGYSERAIFLIDKLGIIRYIDIHDIDEQPGNQELLEQIRKIDPEAASKEPTFEDEKLDSLPRGGIVMYCTRWCPGCRRARIWFEEKGLEFKEIDVFAVPEAAEQVKKWAGGNRVTPTFDIDGTIVINFDQKRLTELLKDRFRTV
jgi:peroxiredoxin